MKNKILILNLVLSFLVFTSVYARKNVPDTTNNQGNNKVKALAAGCASSQAYNFLSINNVRARINTGGDMWWDLQGSPVYEVPKGSGKHSMFAAALWIGGKDQSGNIKVAAHSYRSRGNDYYSGPLTTDGTADIDKADCKKYDRHYILYKKDVESFYAYRQNPSFYPDYVVPQYFYDYPAHGDVSKFQSYYLAPFFDADGDGIYNVSNGDYPFYEVGKNTVDPKSPQPTMEGNGILKDQILKGDMTLWWVFNDKGNTHSETSGDPIGFEFRAQAFGFATNDELNDMTFYSYEIINRSTFTLDSTYFSQWTDSDVGYAFDDFVGCDVARGLGYAYNGKEVDGSGQQDHYGANPPAIGMDFFQGPYMEPYIDTATGDTVDRKKVDANGEPLCDASINGVNFADGVPGNERFGMQKFLYYNNDGAMNGNPDDAPDYYNYLRGRWRNGNKMYYGGDAYNSSNVSEIVCNFMFPADTDPCNWGTGGIDPWDNGWNAVNPGTQFGNTWTEQGENNAPADRRFMQSAGPFTLMPGAVNYITVGVPWARAASGTAYDAVRLLKVADDKCQALFDNNFRIINGPEAPQLVIQEMDKELILFLNYSPCDAGADANLASGCNYQARYEEFDYKIKAPEGEYYDTTYNFEGYKVYQVKDKFVTISDLDDPDKARIVAQCDLKNGIGRIVNYTYNTSTGGTDAVIMVDGADKGIVHSFRIFEDQFSSLGNSKLVNNKQYYFMAVAYAYNNFKTFSPSDPTSWNGQSQPYLEGRSGSYGGSIVSFIGTPHIPSVEGNGTIANATYGEGVEITRLEGNGNGGNELRLAQESVDLIMDGQSDFPEQPWRHDILKYQKGYGPLNIKVVDPLNVVESDFTVKLFLTDLSGSDTAINTSNYVITDNVSGEVIEAHRTIDVKYEQLLIDYGISISISQPPPVASRLDWGMPNNVVHNESFINAELVSTATTSWLTFVQDNDYSFNNWIGAGTDDSYDHFSFYQIPDPHDPTAMVTLKGYWDAGQRFENVYYGTWAPYGLTTVSTAQMNGPAFGGTITDMDKHPLYQLGSVMVVFTSDKTKWTRSPIVELGGQLLYNASTANDMIEPRYNISQSGDTTKVYPSRHYLRYGKSVDKDGNVWSGHYDSASTNENDPNFISGYGMGWFPGYAINMENGERLNIMFGENSKFCSENGYEDETGRDMKWNPTSTDLGEDDEIIRGGMHYIYIMANGPVQTNFLIGGTKRDTATAYDYGEWIVNTFKQFSVTKDYRGLVYNSGMWATMPYLNEGTELLSSDMTMYLDVAKQYRRYYSYFDQELLGNEINDGYPLYTFSTRGLGTKTNDAATAKSALDLINIVPNPYNAFSDYEEDQLDNRVRITNLPIRCDITVYSMNGVLIRELTRDDNTLTYLDWDMKNYAGVPVSSGIYLIHVKSDFGERVLKFFCTMRPTDLNAF